MPGPVSASAICNGACRLLLPCAQLDVRCVFLAAGEPAVRDRVVGAGFGVHTLNGVASLDETDLRQTLDTAAHEGCEGIIVDSYTADESYLGRLRGPGLMVVAIEDTSSVPFPCHLLVNGGAQAPALPYRSSTGDTRFLLGPEYALLREEFWSVPARAVADPVRPVRKILLTMGGFRRAEPDAIGSEAIRAPGERLRCDGGGRPVL